MSGIRIHSRLIGLSVVRGNTIFTTNLFTNSFTHNLVIKVVYDKRDFTTSFLRYKKLQPLIKGGSECDLSIIS